MKRSQKLFGEKAVETTCTRAIVKSSPQLFELKSFYKRVETYTQGAYSGAKFLSKVLQFKLPNVAILPKMSSSVKQYYYSISIFKYQFGENNKLHVIAKGSFVLVPLEQLNFPYVTIFYFTQAIFFNGYRNTD